MSTRRVLCDLDAIVTDLLDPWLSAHNIDYPEHVLEKKDIHTFEIHRCSPCGHKIYEYLHRPGLYRELKPLAGAIESLAALVQDRRIEFAICTASASEPQTAADKLSWVREMLPFLNRRQVFIGHLKYWIKSDFFIDDSPDNILEYRNAWPRSRILTIAHPYNKDVRELVDLYADGYENTAKAWDTILQFIRDELDGA